MIWPLFKHNLRENKILLIAFTAIIMMYATISIGMFDPDSVEAMEQFLNMMPEVMIRMMGFDILGSDITSYLSNYMYGFILLMFPMIFNIMLGVKLVSKHVDTGSMTFIITTPYSRIQIIVTQVLFYALSLFTILFINIVIMISMSEIMFPGTMAIGPFIMLNVVTISVHLALAALVFFLGVLFDDTSRTIGVASGILVLFFILNMLYKLSDDIEFLRYFTPYALINIDYILEGDGNGWLSALSAFISAIAIFTSSIFVFNRKNLII